VGAVHGFKSLYEGCRRRANDNPGRGDPAPAPESASIQSACLRKWRGRIALIEGLGPVGMEFGTKISHRAAGARQRDTSGF